MCCIPGSTVVEQIPGLVVFEDETQQLERGYWPSYNVPYFKVIYQKSKDTAATSFHNIPRDSLCDSRLAIRLCAGGYPQIFATQSSRSPEHAEAVAGVLLLLYHALPA